MAAGAPDDELVFLPLGGSGEIGMNFNAYGYGPAHDRQWIIVDCGVLFGRESNQPGVDVLMPDIRALTENREKILGIVATHAHEDHIGAIAHLWPMLRCPVYATPFTARRWRSWATRVCWRWFAIPPMPWCRAPPVRKARCAKA